MFLRVKLLGLFCLLMLSALSLGQEEKKVSLGRVAQATALTKVYSRPSTRAHIFYSVHPAEYLVVKDYKKDSPWKLVLMKNGTYAYARTEGMKILDYEYKVAGVATDGRSTTITDFGFARR